MTEAVSYIPYTGSSDPGERESIVNELLSSQPDGQEYEWRMKAYQAAWYKCLSRVQDIVRELYAPVADQVVADVKQAYSDPLPGLPCVEIPVISITDRSGGSDFLRRVAMQLDHGDDDDNDDTAFVIDLYSADCLNITSAMKTMITGFINKSPNSEGAAKRKPTASLAVYDIQLLEAWYQTMRDEYYEEQLPKLVVTLHDFEQFDSSIVQDMLYICSLHVPSLPIVFILSLSSPHSPSYLHLAYPRSTLSLLRVRHFLVPAGETLLAKIVTKTFFDVKFQADIILGPTAIEFLLESFRKHDTSMDSVITALQLAHLKHFEQEDSLTAFVHNDPTDDIDLTLLRTRLGTQSVNEPLRNARTNFYSRSCLGRSWQLDSAGSLVNGKPGKTSAAVSEINLMCTVLRGLTNGQFRSVEKTMKNFALEDIKKLLTELYMFFKTIPQPLMIGTESAARRQVTIWINDLPDDTAETIATWLTEYLKNLLQPFEDLELWDIWYTGRAPFPSELINPAPRASIVNALVDPWSYVAKNDRPEQERIHGDELWTLPDTTILFRRYIDSGKMINVFDWFQSFALVLDAQRRNERSNKARGNATPKKSNGFHVGRGSISGSPSKKGKSPTKTRSIQLSPSKGKGKGKAKQVDEDVNMMDVDDQEEEVDADDDEWKVEVQARFMRALHELDYLGFIKHTGRKADHVMRTVFDVVGDVDDAI